jgi:hypothetical protein
MSPRRLSLSIPSREEYSIALSCLDGKKRV